LPNPLGRRQTSKTGPPCPHLIRCIGEACAILASNRDSDRRKFDHHGKQAAGRSGEA
jgi:hypothetical protein